MSQFPCRLVLPSAFALALSATPGVSKPAQAVSFQFDFGTNTSDELQRATQEAAGVWSSLLKDDVTVNLRIDYADLSEAGSVLGGVQPGKIKVKYEDYVEALFKDAISSDDFLGISTLPLSSKGREAFHDFQTGNIDIGKVKLESKEFAFLMDGQFAKGGGRRSAQPDFLDNNGNNNNKNVLLTRAQAKALNLLDSNKQGLDGLITINSNAVWDFDRSDGIDGNRHDISSVLQHEIGHALGFVSGVDALDFLASASEPVDIENNKFSYLTPLDFYRYSAESTELGVSDVTLGGSEKYFSLDGGKSAVVNEAGEAAYFSTGSYKSGGDGYQGSHWKSSGTPLGIMNPNLQTGQSIDISSLDLMLLDVIGWNTKDTFAERAAAVGFDWLAFDNELKADRQQLTRALVEQWDGSIPNVEAALADAAAELDLKFRQKLQDKFDELVEKLAKESDSKKRNEALNKFYKDINKESEKRNESIGKLPKEIIKVDNDVRKWLDLPVDKLADKIRDADGSKINRFSNIIKALPEDDRDDVEERLEEAASQLVDNPGKLVEDLLKTSGPANPIGWNNYLRWWWWWQQDGNEGSDQFEFDDGDDSLGNSETFESLYYAQSAASTATVGIATVIDSSSASTFDEPSTFDELSPLASSSLKLTTFADTKREEARDVPEPSSALAMFGITAIGASLLRRKKVAVR